MRRTTAVAVLSVLLLAGAIGLPLVGVLWHREAERDVSAARLVRQDLDRVFVASLNAVTGVRGYVLTGDPEFLAPYESGLGDFEVGMGALRENIHDEEARQQAEALEQRFRAWLTAAGAPQVDLVRAGNREEAQSMVATGEGRQLFQEVYRSHNVLDGLLAAEEMAARQDLSSARGVAGALFVAGLVCAVGLGGTVAHLVRERRRYERELEATRVNLAVAEHLSTTRGEMLSAASHELRNPLTALLLAAEVLAIEARRSDGDGLAELADEIGIAARRTGQMVAELLDYTRIESGRLSIEHEALQPRQVVEGAIEDVRLSKPTAAFEVDVAIPPELQIEGDFPRLRMAVRNLLENALRYGQPPYRVRLEGDGTMVEIHVEDGGPGVPADERSGIFDRFQRGSTAEGTDGTGIGLYLSRGIVELHGGRLEVGESDLGGADFTVALPGLRPAT
jgi:signal transduction histidine kinase